MSIEAEDETHKIEIEDLNTQILRELRFIRMILAEATEIEMTKDDLDE